MDRQEKIEHISRLPIFSELNKDEIETFESLFQERIFRAGEYVYRQAEHSYAMYLFLKGRGRLLRVGPDGIERRGEDVEPGEYVGEKSLFEHDARPSSLLIVRDATVLVLPRREFEQHIRRNPRIKARLNVLRKFVAEDAPEQDFAWLNRGEIVLRYTHRHIWAFYRRAALAIPMVIFLLPMPLVIALAPFLPNVLAGIALPFAFILPIMYIVYCYFDWTNDWFVVTNQRVAREEKVLLTFNQAREQAPLESIQSVRSVQAGYFEERLNFGDLIISTAGAGGTLLFSNVPDPDSLARIIQDELGRTTSYKAATDRDKIRQEIDKFLGTEALARTRAKDIPQPGPSVKEPDLPEPVFTRMEKRFQKVMDYFDLRVRIDEEWRVIYRKHWLTLWQDIFAPIFFLVLLLIVIGIATVNVGQWPWNAFHPLILAAIAIALLGVNIVWFWWVYEDWHNDLYIVEEQMLTHIHRRPLWLENIESKIPVRNIQGVNIEVKGVWQQVLNYGTVIVQTAADATPLERDPEDSTPGVIRFTYIYQPQALQEDILRLQRNEIQDGEEHQNDMIAEQIAHWLAIYHQATNTDDFDDDRTAPRDIIDKGQVQDSYYYRSEDE